MRAERVLPTQGTALRAEILGQLPALWRDRDMRALHLQEPAWLVVGARA